MATQKSNKQGQKSGGMDWGAPVHNHLDVGNNGGNKNEQDIPITIILCISIMALTFVIAIPIIGIMLLDANNATNAAVQEIKKMRELRAKMLMMMQGE